MEEIDDKEKIHRLDMLIPPEIKEGDGFYEDLRELASMPEVETILEIGSSDGNGSTKAIMDGVKERACYTYHIESSVGRFSALLNNYPEKGYMSFYNYCSIPVLDYMTADNVIDFYADYPTNTNNYPIGQVLGWLKEELDYIRDNKIPGNGIYLIMEENKIDSFDLVLIDGSAFTAETELSLIYTARYIALDDIIDIKNYNNYQFLSSDPNYELIKENKQLRNGYAIFKRSAKQCLGKRQK